MRLVSLALEHFRQHMRSQISFEHGLVGIIGPNGAGKTTLVEAIAFALFGSKALRGKLDEVKTRGAPKDAEVRIGLIFEQDGQIWRIDRGISDAELFQAGETRAVVNGNREVSNRIAHLLGMTLEEFKATYYTEQKGLEFLSGQKGASERERFILRILGYDRFERMQDLMRQDKRDRRNEISGWEAGLGNREELQDKLAQERANLELLEGRYSDSAQAVKENEKQAEERKRTLRGLEERRKAWEIQRNKEVELEARFRTNLEHEKQLAARVKQISEQVEQELTVISGESGREIKSIAEEIVEKLDKVRNQAKELEEELAEAERARTQKIAEVNGRMTQIASDLQKLEARQAGLLGLSEEAECPTCRQPLGRSFAAVKEHFSEEVRKLKKEAAELEGAKETAAKPHNNSARAQTELKARREERHRLETLVKKVEEINNQRQAALSYAKDLEEVRRAAEQARTELEKVRAKAGSTVQYDEEEYLGAKGAFEAAEKLCNVARLQLVKIEGEVKTSKALIARSEIDLERYDEKVAKLKEAKELLLLLEESDRLLTEFRKHVNGAIRPRLAELAGEFISDLTDGRYTAVELGQDFSPTVVEDGEAKAVISGGEEDILNLCMRLALSHMLAERSGHNFSLLIMDEVFGSLDEGRRMNLLALLEKLSRRFEQIVVITHLDDIKEGVQRTYYVDFDEASGEAVIDGQEELEAGVANL